MNEIRKHRIVLVLAAAVMLSVAIYFFMYQPAALNIRAKSGDVEALESEINTLTGVLGTAEHANELTRTLAEQRSEKLNQIYSIDSIEVFIDNFTATLEAWGMSEVKVAPVIEALLAPATTELDGAKLAKVKFDIRAQGTLINGGQATEEIESHQYFIAMPYLTIEHSDRVAPESVWSFQLLAYFRTGDQHDG